MIEASLLKIVIFIEMILIVVALVLYLGHGVWRLTRRRRDSFRLATGRAALGDIAQARDTERALSTVDRLPARIQLQAFEEIGPKVSGIARLRISEAAQQVGVSAKAGRQCLSRFWWKRLRAARILTLVGGSAETVAPMLDDKVPEVAAQAAEWAAEHPNPELIRRLLSMLDDPRGLARFTVQDSLTRLGGTATTALIEWLEDERPGLASALEVSRGVADQRFMPAAIKWAGHEDPAVCSSAVRLLGAIGGTAVIERLEELLDDEMADVRAAAIGALAQLGHWPAAPQIAARLTDHAWDVRKAAGAALGQLGAPGLFYLRRAIRSEDRFAADMARYVLGLPRRVRQMVVA